MLASSVPGYLMGLPRATKRAIAVTVDVVMCVASVHLAYYLRTNMWAEVSGPVVYPVMASVLFSIPIFVIFGLYRAIFRHSGAAAMGAIARAVAIYAVPFAFVFTYIGLTGVPRTIGLIQPLLLFMMVAGSRVVVNLLLGGIYRDAVAGEKKPRVLIYGAGSAGRQVASALQISGQVKVVGFVDDDRSLWKATINGLKVHDPSTLGEIAERHRITDILMAIAKAPRARRNEIVVQLKQSGLHVRSMPGVDQLARGTVSFSDLRDIEIEDLLGRSPIPPDTELLQRNISDKIVMVTGAGGSIGSEICRQAARLGPDILLLVDSSEYNLYAIHQELSRDKALGEVTAKSIVPLLATVRDPRRVDEIVGVWRPHTIYHAAAYKHVPLVEYNLIEGVANNVLGTLNVAAAAREFDVDSLVLISTDKAVRPTNVMGATKRLAEIILQAMAEDGVSGTFSIVRFGNVLGSSGSVVPLFRSQIAAGGPVTITDAEITRYFMTIPEAAQLVIQAGAMAHGGDVFVLDMGDPVRIIDLARSMITLSGYSVKDPATGEGDIAIDCVGLRPGEKLYEELLIGNAPTSSTHPRIMRAHEPSIAWPQLRLAIDAMQGFIATGDAAGARALLRELVIEFVPNTDMMDLAVLARRP